MRYRTFAAYNAAAGLIRGHCLHPARIAAAPDYRTAERLAGQVGAAVLAAALAAAASAAVLARRRLRRIPAGR